MTMEHTSKHLWDASTDLRRSNRGRALGVLALLVGLGLALVALTACAKGEAAQVSSASAAAAQAVSTTQEAKLFCYVETLTADRPSIYGYMAPRGCMPSGAFHRTERMVFRFEILDVAGGETVTSEEAASVVIRLPYVAEEKAIFKQRGDGNTPDAPWTWEVCWDVPEDYPVGSLDYSIIVNFKDGRKGEWKPPALVDPSRGVDSRPQIIA